MTTTPAPCKIAGCPQPAVGMELSAITPPTGGWAPSSALTPFCRVHLKDGNIGLAGTSMPLTWIADHLEQITTRRAPHDGSMVPITVAYSELVQLAALMFSKLATS